jgi:protein-disulfide isomerase
MSTTMTDWGDRLALPVTPGRDHIRGRPDAPVTMVEYGDFECPFCGAAYPVVEAVRAAAGDALGFVFRHFPLTTVHPRAFQAAEAAEAAGGQGEFWPMHDLLFEDQAHLDSASLLARAVALELDVDRFRTDLMEHTRAERVHEDFISGVHSGVQGTPTFFVNGVRYDGPRDAAGMLAAVEHAAHVRA